MNHKDVIWVCTMCDSSTQYDNRPCDNCDAHYDCFIKYIPLSHLDVLVEALERIVSKESWEPVSGDKRYSDVGEIAKEALEKMKGGMK